LGLLFEHLTIPALNLLHVASSKRMTIKWPSLAFAQFQSRSSVITRIELSSISIPSAELIIMLRSAPLIRHLYLSECLHCIDDAFLGALLYRVGDSPLAPQLISLHLLKVGRSFRTSCLERTIRSR
jgi:hypothetical protein